MRDERVVHECAHVANALAVVVAHARPECRTNVVAHESFGLLTA